MVGFIGKVTDAVGLTDFSGAEDLSKKAQKAYGLQLGTSRDLIDWWKGNARPYQRSLMDRADTMYQDADLTDADYADAMGQTTADVAQAYKHVWDANNRRLGRYGINPAAMAAEATRFGNDEAATLALAKNQTRRGMKDSEFRNKAAAIGVGSSVNAPNYGMLSTGMHGLSSSASGLGQMGMAKEQGSNEVMGSLIEGITSFADGGEVRPGLRRRGEVRGPGTAVSDDIPARLSNGEVVFPTDTVAAIGRRFVESDPERAAHRLGVKVLEDEIEKTHTPASHQKKFGLTIDARPGEDGTYAYADGGEAEAVSPWMRGLKALGAGYLNAVSRGGYVRGVERRRRHEMEDAELARKRDREEEERVWTQEQRGRQRQTWERQDAYQGAMDKAYEDATTAPFVGGDINDPEFGLEAAYGGQGKFGMKVDAPLDEKKYLAGIDRVQAQYMPDAYLSRRVPGKPIKLGLDERLVGPDGRVLLGADEQAVDANWEFDNKTGLFWNTKTGETRRELPADVRDRIGNGEGGETSDYNAFKSGLRDMFAKMDPAGNFFMPEGSDKEYGRALEIGNKLLNMGVPIGQATNMAYGVVRGPLKEDEARQQAELEGSDKFGWGEGDERKAFIEGRTKQLMDESRQALRQYEQLTGGGATQDKSRKAVPRVGREPVSKPAGKKGNGTREDPVSVATPSDAQSLPPGTYFITPNGDLRVKR